MGLEHDISCLYAAKNFAQYLQLGQPAPLQPQSQFLTRLNELVEKHAKSVYDEFKGREQELAALEEGTKEQQEQSQSIIMGFCTKAYEKLVGEIEEEYKKERTPNMLTPEDKHAYHQCMSELSPEYMFMFMAGTIEDEALANLSESDRAATKELDDWVAQQEEKHNDYLASAGINTPQGNVAWKVARYTGRHFSSFIYSGEAYTELALQRQSKTEVQIPESELEKHVSIGIATGLLCAKERAIIAEEDLFSQTAIKWLSKEISDRLSKGVEFNLLDEVSVKKESDGFIYVKLDKRKLY